MKKILIIEDDTILSKTFESHLKEEGYDTEIALDGELGLKKAKETNPDLIILDLILPKLHGLLVLKEIKNTEDIKNIPVIVLTNLENEDVLKEAESLGCADYLIKSNYSLGEISMKIKKVLG